MYIFRLVVRFFLAEGLSLLLISAAFDNLSKAADNYAAIATPRIEAPIYFYYMDSSKIESLYNQLQPELEIKERETIGKISVKGETKVEANSVRVGVEAGSENQTRSTYAATGFATDRKCLEVMRYVLATWPSNYYTSPDEWMLRRIGQPLMQMYKSLGGLGRFSPLQQTRSPLPDSRDVVAELHSQLRAELQQLRGHLFIDGDFERSVGHGGVVLVRRFDHQTLKCSFRVYLSTEAGKKLPKEKPLRLRVFGDVTKPLTEDGFVDVVGIAVY